MTNCELVNLLRVLRIDSASAMTELDEESTLVVDDVLDKDCATRGICRKKTLAGRKLGVVVVVV